MTMTSIDITTIEPIGHGEAHGLAETEYRRLADLLARLSPDDWARQTDCPGWTVRDMAGHVVGAMRAAASLREMFRQQREIQRRVKRDGGNETDVMTALQIELTEDLGVEALVAECRSLVGPAARGRKRTPSPMRRFVRFPVEIGTISETWRLGYLVDVILTRDTWMHRIDVCRATGSEPTLDAAHDGRLVADVAAEWARRHGRPVILTLRGPAGGEFLQSGTNTSSASTERVDLDAVEFCCIVSGRARGTGLLSQQVPF